jgi:hypothetical protein
MKFHYNKIKEKILLINLDDTLIHCSDNYLYHADLIIPQKILNENNQKVEKYIYINFNPGAISFIEEISNYFEIITFSSLISLIGEQILSSIDLQNRIYLKLFFDKNDLIERIMKDLNILGDIKNIIFLDNSKPPIYNEANRIPIKNWYDSYNNLELYKLIPILKNLNGFYDVKTEICKFVQNNTFIWGKAISWIREFLLNTTYLNEIDNILKMEKTNIDIQMSSQRNRDNNQYKFWTCNTSNDIYNEFNNSFYLNLYDKTINDINGEFEHINTINYNNEKKNNNDFIKITFYNNDLNSKSGNDDNDFDKDYCINRLVTEEDKSYKKKLNKFINNPNEKINFRNEKKDNFRRCNSMTKKKFHLIKKPILSSLKGIIMKKNIQDNKKLNTSQDNVLLQKLKNKRNVKQNIKNSKIHLSQDKMQKNNPYKFITKIQKITTNNNVNSNFIFKKRGNHFSSYSINLNNNSQC